MSTLGAADFPTFFEEVYDQRPYKWQSRLATQVVETGEWPELLDLPTGTGKTAALDIALFALAARHENDLPRRIVFVVDRRIIVHQAARRVERLVEALDPTGDSIAAVVARRLKALAPAPDGVPDGPVVRWSELRGGIVRDESWATRPDVPAVLVSTVDQVGSRLLFRGYGVSRGMRPIHAGLLGADTLFLLDEVHLARPFRTTLRAIGSRYRGSALTSPLPDRWQVVELSATPSEEVERRFTITAEDRQSTSPADALAVAELERRLGASKPAVLREVKSPAASAGFAKAIVGACVAEVQRLLAANVGTIGVVVNRVASAVAVERALEALGHEDVMLVTGRVRSIDRDAIVRELETHVGAGRVRNDDAKPVIVVSTQAIEAGADLDLDAIVTECASLDALQQRFGRVDRAGKLSAAGQSATSVVLGMSTAVMADADDPVYGGALAATWAWLGSVADEGMVDFGSERLGVPEGDERARLLPPQVWCPQLFPSQLDRWVQTSTEPHADPVVAHWLHGLVERPDDVSVIWRAEITRELLATRGAVQLADGAQTTAAGLADELFEMCPPDSREAMSLPARAVRQWLIALGPDSEGAVSDDVSDAAAQSDNLDPRRRSGRMAPVVLVSADGVPGESQIVDRQSSIRPGVTIVVPLSYGGIRAGSWDPTEREVVEDRATAARALADRRGVVRLITGGSITRRRSDEQDKPPSLPVPEPLSPDVDAADQAIEDDETVMAWLDAFVTSAATSPGKGAGPQGDWAGRIEFEVASHLLRLPKGHRKVRRMSWIEAEATVSERFVVSARRRMSPVITDGLADESGVAVDSEPETSSFVGQEVPLPVHLADVRAWGKRLAANLELPGDLVDDIALAGWFHDLGKADPRFQRMLRQGQIGSNDELLAKSGLASGDRRARQRAQRASDYPPGARHELLSVALVEDCDALMAQAHDRDLVLHLVASHHGHCRPFAPVVLEDRPVEVVVEHDGVRLAARSDHRFARVDSGIPERFWLLTQRYGWWGLAWLEAVLRLADHRASEDEQRQREVHEAKS